MEVSMSLSHLQMLLGDAAELGARKAIDKLGLAKPTISKSQAYKLYGEGLVDRWIREGLIKTERDSPNHTWRIDASLLEALAKSSNRHSFLKTKGL